MKNKSIQSTTTPPDVPDYLSWVSEFMPQNLNKIKPMNAIENLINDLACKAIQGERHPLEIYIILRDSEIAIKNALDAIKDDVMSEANKYPEKSFEFNGRRLEKRGGAGRWDFKHIKDWTAKKDEIKQIEEGAKEAYKSAQKGIEMYGMDGVQVEPAKYTPGADVLAVSFKK